MLSCDKMGKKKRLIFKCRCFHCRFDVLLCILIGNTWRLYEEITKILPHSYAPYGHDVPCGNLYAAVQLVLQVCKAS